MQLLAQAPDAGLAEALRAHQEGRLEEAAKAYRKYLATHPNSIEAHSNLGTILSREGNYAEAVLEYKAALKRSPGNANVAFNLALAYYKGGQIPDAVRELTTLRLLAPDNPRVALLLADSLLRMGENEKVAALLTPIEQKQPEDLAVAYLLGTALVRSKRVDDGQRILNKIFEKGDSAESRLLLATAKLNIADFRGALADLEVARKLNAAVPSLYALLGEARQATGDTPGALEAYRKELEGNPNDFDSNLNVGLLLRQDRDYAQARRHLDMALRVRPGDLRARYQIAAIDLAEDRIEEARAELESVVKEAPSYTVAHVSLATVYYRLNRKADGDREGAIVKKLNAEEQAKQPKGEPVNAASPGQR